MHRKAYMNYFSVSKFNKKKPIKHGRERKWLLSDEHRVLTGNEIVIASHAYTIARGMGYHLRLRGTAAQNDNRGPTSFLVHYIASILMMHVFDVPRDAETERSWLEFKLLQKGDYKIRPFLIKIYEHADKVRNTYMTSEASGIMNEPNAADFQQGITALLKRKMQSPSFAPVLHNNIQT